MQKFRRRSYEVEAFWVSPESFKDYPTWPQWMIAAWNKDGNTPGKLYDNQWFLPHDEHIPVDGPCSLIKEDLETQLVKWYNWIVREDNGTLKVYTEHELYTLFEIIP